MASNSGVQQSFQQQFKCKECGLALNSAESLEVHRQYHEENLIQQCAVKAQGSSNEEKANNMTKQPAAIKREFASNNYLPGDSSDIHKKSPDYHIYTPQSFQSAFSPYQNNDNSAFSPNFQNYHIVKSEGNSPASQQQQQSHYQNVSNFPEQQQQFFSMDSNNHFQDIHSNKASFRYQPHGRPQYYEHSKPSVGAPQVSPAYPSQPTPSPSPKLCDKCGYVCESAAQLIEHNNLTHSNNAQVQAQYNHSNHFTFDPQVVIREEDTSQSEILDLNSHKVVHPDWVDGKEGDKRSNGDSGIPHSVSVMLNSWPPQAHQQFQGEHNMYINDTGEQKIFPNLNSMQEGKMFSTDQKLFPSHQMDNQNFINNTVSSSSQEMGSVNQQSYRPFEHFPTAPSSVITSTQVPQVPTANPPTAPTGTKSASWKSNEARMPKNNNYCTVCNKVFTHSGHLKRHYNTSLHKDTVKYSGQPDPATMPISEDGNATSSPSISSTVEIQDDLSKTKCFDCDQVFNRPCYLTQHNKTCHNGEKPFKCSKCGKRFSDEETYKEHTRKHAANKPHKCDICPRTFSHKGDHTRHLFCHTEQKPYACEICRKGFIRKDRMMKHMMDTHK